MTKSEDKAQQQTRPDQSLTIFVTIFGLFLVVSLVTGASIALTNYFQLRSSATQVANETFQNTIDRIDEKKESLFGVLILFAELFADSPAVKREGATMEGLLSALLRGLTLNPHVLEVYAGYENGDYYQIFSFLEEDANIIEGLDGPDSTRYAVHEIALQDDGTRKESWRFLDNDQNELSYRENYSPSYDPRVRGWYQAARADSGQTVRTAPYVFAISPEVGMTFGKSFDGPEGGVFAADITLDRFSSFLKSIRPNALHKILVFDDQMRSLAHPNADEVLKRTGQGDDLLLEPAKVTDLSDPIVQETVALFNTDGPFHLESFSLDGVEYLASVEMFEYGEQSDYVLYAAPRSEFEGRIAEAASSGLLAGILVILLSIPFVFILTRTISKPLAGLSDEAALIQSFNLDSPITLKSYVRELDTLIGSMINMKKTMRSISKFVPKALVRDILQSGDTVEVGGERRHLSLLFTDVKDFTPISDSMEPEDLMLNMSEYFEDLVGLIIDQGGTVDKFVGDAIFSYWNAPLPIDRYEYLACYTALECRYASEQLGQRWAEEGRLRWNTRFGVHAGDAVVGNVGSSDRIDFTAIGDTVNIASRLEGLNKFYGTSILVSGQIVKACERDFLFRHVDSSLPKGAGSPVEIYEPLGTTDPNSNFAATPEHFAFVAEWDVAYRAYIRRDWVSAFDAMDAFAAKHPNDGVARVYLDRITEFLLEPPAKEWDGIMRFSQK